MQRGNHVHLATHSPCAHVLQDRGCPSTHLQLRGRYSRAGTRLATVLLRLCITCACFCDAACCIACTVACLLVAVGDLAGGDARSVADDIGRPAAGARQVGRKTGGQLATAGAHPAIWLATAHSRAAPHVHHPRCTPTPRPPVPSQALRSALTCSWCTRWPCMLCTSRHSRKA